MLSLESLAHPAGIASLLFLVVLFIYWYGTRGFADLKKLNVPGPKPIPFLGNFLEARKYDGVHLMYLDYTKEVRQNIRRLSRRSTIACRCGSGVIKNRYWSRIFQTFAIDSKFKIWVQLLEKMFLMHGMTIGSESVTR